MCAGALPLIGLFDSGVGGLTVAKAIQDALPSHPLLYYGDSIHLPYGNKSEANILHYSKKNAEFLFQKGAEIVVVACNTATAVALPTLRATFQKPVMGVIEPGVVAALKKTFREPPNQQKAVADGIAVIGTLRTIKKHEYRKVFLKQHQALSRALRLSPLPPLYEIPCPLLVPLIEEQFPDKKIIEQITLHYLKAFMPRVSVLVLGCTHYPLLKPLLKTLFPQVAIVDSAEETAKAVAAALPPRKTIAAKKNYRAAAPPITIYTNDLNEVFENIAKQLFPTVLPQLI